ncbi:sigma-70 family RNA polymerase sigma factor [Desulfogranum mediterraneum]|uniref:sigma-70 family RNA polymerase sigma factor n=1 Tax=Desulfogranum mediterraneum TaxID=160661 RepID=UPI00048FBAC2|nr:RNA polymerase factor sigma-32 [Desulfogranum mediterraneum]
MTQSRDTGRLDPNSAQHHPLVVSSNEENLPALSNPALHRYLQEISQYELLSREETDELAIRFQETGDPDAAYRLVSSNLRLVVKVAMDFQKYWMQNFMDLIQEGNVGLVQATKKFDPYRGVKFSYYAAYWIRAYILKFIMDNWRLVKIGTTQAQRKLFFSLNKEKKLLEAQGFKPEVKLLAERLNVKESEVIEMGQRMDNWDVSLEAPVRSDSEDEQKSFLPHEGPGIEEIVASHEMRERLMEVLAGLNPHLNEKEQVILSSRLLSDEPKTLQTIADEFHISRERVRQIEANLLKKLRKQLEKEMPDIHDFFSGDSTIFAQRPLKETS